MRTIGLAAILALTSTAAFAGSFQFSIGGHNARIDFDESCTDRLCASVSWQGQGSRERTRIRLPEVSAETISKFIAVPKPHWNSPMDDDEETAEPSSAGPPAVEPPVKLSAKPATDTRQANDDAAITPRVDEDDATPASLAGGEPPAPVAAGAVKQAGTSKPPPPVRPAAAPQETKVASVAPKTAPESTKPARPTPVGEWLVEDGEGKIRIEPCGNNLCGVVSAAKNANAKDSHNPNPALRNRAVLGTPILINMKPNGRRWSGRIYNVKDGRSYTAHISLRNANTLRVEGCAFGGMICGGQNWSRVN